MLSSLARKVANLLTKISVKMSCATTTCFIKQDSNSVYAELGYQMIRRDCGYGCDGGFSVYIHNSVQFECLGSKALLSVFW